ncbi:cellulose biosynthesis protein BcsS [Microbaculum marinum]|uniref:Cellulose biosynthesis protein BcsS n=1 Tax=Microbaculum marinum TaxID=1764581 RepID=A0AAW9RUQ8_9HYPH
MAWGKPRRRICIARWRTTCLLSAAGLALSFPLQAPAGTELPPRWHLFFGGDSAAESMFGHAGLVWAPVDDLHQTGWRLRAIAGGGEFAYLSGSTRISGRLLTAAVMPGFEWIGDDAGVTIYGGATVQDQTTRPHDPGKSRQGTRFGAKARIEGWFRPTSDVVLNGSGSYATAAESYTARISANVALSPHFALEPEMAAFGEPGYDQQRYGLLVEYRHDRQLTLKLGGGWAIEPDDDGPYVAFQVKTWR